MAGLGARDSLRLEVITDDQCFILSFNIYDRVIKRPTGNIPKEYAVEKKPDWIFLTLTTNILHRQVSAYMGTTSMRELLPLRFCFHFIGHNHPVN